MTSATASSSTSRVASRILIAALAVAGAAASAEAPKPFDPVAFFTGPTQGKGVLKELVGKEKRALVQSFGRVGDDGWLTLDQKVAIEGEPLRQRRWRLKQVSPGKFSGSINDAKGPVEAEIVGQSVRIHYKMKNNLKVEQTLTPVSGGRALDNRTTFSRWGVKVATLTERIDKR